ncbi:MAG: hypothetical protein JWQ07_3231 [Ramlibacter sp.]|nr:hypothetical protein [Ramlibacter sp.]
MNAVLADRPDQSNAGAVTGLRVAALVMLCLAGFPAFAGDDASNDAPIVLAQAGMTPAERNRPQLEVTTSSVPRFDNTDGSNRSSRLDMTWLPPRRSALGLSLGMTSPDSTSLGSAPRTGLQPTVDLGLHWRYTLDSNYRFDVTAWRRMVPPDALTLVQTREASYGARVEMQLGHSVPKSGFNIERGFIGLQLESGARVTLKRSGGKPMMYYRSKF